MSQPALPTAPAGCVIRPVETDAYLAWLLGGQQAAIPEDATGLVWALAHCDDGVTWGRYAVPDAPSWNFGNQFFPDVSPAIQRESLQELRIFGKKAEVLIWRTDSGLRGRMLRESDPPADRNDVSDPLRPSDESRIVRGDECLETPQSGFAHVADRTGAEQVIPLEVSDQQLQKRLIRLCVRHYYEQDRESGAVRIAATRLVDLTTEGADGS